MESAALDLAKKKTEEKLIETEFDEQWLNSTIFPSSPSELTPTNGFGMDGDDAGLFDDIDDYHNTTELNELHSIGADTFRFNINYQVSYVNIVTGDTTSTQTYAKQLTTNVVSADSIGNRVARVFYSKTTIISEDI